MKIKKVLLFVLFLGSLGIMTACGSKADGASEKVIIYTNADDEPIQVIEKVLDENGYKDKYKLQSFGTSELGGKLLAEGTSIEADLVTMSTFYLNSAQMKDKMFESLTLPLQPLAKTAEFTAPFTMQEGAIFYNTDVVKEENISVPKSLKDLAKPEYKGHISISDIKQSSTAWLLFQALIDQYGEAEAQTILKDIYANAGNHLESSGSGPIKKVRLGEVAIGFGLRHQAVKDKEEGLPIDYIEPSEGTYTLTESLAIIDKGDNTNPEAAKMLDLILTKGREDLLEIYPSPIYQDEVADEAKMAKHLRVFPQDLTAELLKKHQDLVE